MAYIILLLAFALAIIPALIAKEKGYSFVGFYIFGFCFFLPALIVALIIEDKRNQRVYYEPTYQPIVQSETQIKCRESVFVRNCFINSPLRPAKAEIVYYNNHNIVISVFVKTYSDDTYESIRSTIEAYDVFDTLLFSKDELIQKPNKTQAGFLFDVAASNVEPGSIKYLEVYIPAYMIGSDIVKIEDAKKSDSPVDYKDLAENKQRYGLDAITRPEMRETDWTCVCGNRCEARQTCSVCGRTAKSADEPLSNGVIINSFCTDIQTITDVSEIKIRLLDLGSILDPIKYEEAIKYLDELKQIKRLYSGTLEITDAERDKLINIIS